MMKAMIGAKGEYSILKAEMIFRCFPKSQSRVIISVNRDKKENVEKILKEKGQYFSMIGETGGQNLKINNFIDVSLTKLHDLYYNTIPRIMNG